jgi:hypothetical protein
MMSIAIGPPLPFLHPVAPSLPPALPPEPIMRLSVEQYHFMIDGGLFANDDRVELLEGWLVPKMPQNPPHVLSIGLACDALQELVPAGWHITCQGSVTTPDSEPEPDVGVVRGRRRDYATAHPTPKDAGLIVEVSGTTLARDRGMKKRIYARANVPIYWIANIPDRCIEVYIDPTGPAENPDYQSPHIYGENDRVPVVLDGVEIGQLEVQSILP